MGVGDILRNTLGISFVFPSLTSLHLGPLEFDWLARARLRRQERRLRCPVPARCGSRSRGVGRRIQSTEFRHRSKLDLQIILSVMEKSHGHRHCN